MKRKITFRAIFTFFLALMLIGVQCLGAVVASAANDSVSYTFDEWVPEQAHDKDGNVVENGYKAPTGWSGVGDNLSTTSYYYKEDGAMGYYYKRSGGTIYNNGLKTDLPSGIDKNDFLIDYALYKKRFSGESFAILDTGSSVKWKKAFSTSENKWQQISARFVKNSGKYTALIYVNGALSAKEENLSFDPGKFGIYSLAIYKDNIINILVDNVNIRNTPTSLFVTPSVADGAQNVSTDAVLTYALSQDIDNSTLSAITIKDGSDNTVAANAGYDYRTKTIALKPALNLNTTYTVDFSNVKDILGNSTEIKSYTFTTVKENVYVNETFDSYNAGPEGKDFPVSEKGKWGVNYGNTYMTLSGEEGVFSYTVNDVPNNLYPLLTFTLNNNISEQKLLLDLDYKYSVGGGCALKLYDSRQSYSIAEWVVLSSLPQDNSWHKLQIVITNAASAAESSADVYIDGVYKETTKPKSDSGKTWNGKLSQIAFSPTIYNGNGKRTDLKIDNMILSTIPKELDVTSSLDVKNEGLSLGTDISFTFSNTIDKNTVEAATVEANAAAVGKAEYDAKTKTIVFSYDADTPLTENTTYTVDISGVKDIFGNTPKKTSYTFKTVEKAGVSLDESSFSVREGEFDIKVDGFGGGGVTATVNAANTTPADAKIVLAIAVYDKNFTTMKAIGTSAVTIPAGGAVTPVSAAFAPGEKYTYVDGDCIKVFVLNAGTLMPFKPAFAANSDGEIVKPN